MPDDPADGLVIVQISSRHVAATVAWRQAGHSERVLAHKVVYCHWYDLNDRGRRQALSEAVFEACSSAEVQALSVFVCVADERLQANFAVGAIDCQHEVQFGREEMDLALSRATHQAIAVDREVLHVLPQHWEIRDAEGDHEVDDPLGQSGHRLTCSVLLVTAQRRLRAEIVSLLRECDLELEALIAPPVALYRGLKNVLAKSSCHVVFDCGARHTNVIVHRKNRLVHIETHLFGGDLVSLHLMDRFTLDPARAEQLKQDIDVADHKSFAGDIAGQTYLWRDVLERDRLLGPASLATRDFLLAFFRGVYEGLLKRDILGQKGKITLVGRASSLAGFPSLMQEIFGWPAIYGTGRKDRDPSAELVDLMTTGLIRTAAEERERLLRQRDVSGMHQARRWFLGLRNWLMEPIA
jgi:cell division ATPase FtsA